MLRNVVRSAPFVFLMIANGCGPADARTGSGGSTTSSDLNLGASPGSFPAADTSCGGSTCADGELCCDNLVCEPSCMKVSRCPVYGVACPAPQVDAGSPVGVDASPAPIPPGAGGREPIVLDASSGPPIQPAPVPPVPPSIDGGVLPPAPPPSSGLKWYTTCGYPICRVSVDAGPSPLPPVQVCPAVGSACATKGETCGTASQNNCGVIEICDDVDPKLPGCPL